MTIAKFKPWLILAQSNQFAIGAFNFNTLEQAQAIVAAAEAENAPVVLQVSHNALKYIGSGNHRQGLRYAAAIGREAAKIATIPVILHLDHGTYDEVVEAANLGFSSVMFDGGDLSYAENIAKTQKLREITSELGVTLEAELGEVPKPGGSESEKDGMLTDPSTVSGFIEETSIDALAVSLGSVHGGKQKNTSIDLPRLKKINALANIPLVLHGSSGVKDDEIINSKDGKIHCLLTK